MRAPMHAVLVFSCRSTSPQLPHTPLLLVARSPGAWSGPAGGTPAAAGGACRNQPRRVARGRGQRARRGAVSGGGCRQTAGVRRWRRTGGQPKGPQRPWGRQKPSPPAVATGPPPPPAWPLLAEAPFWPHPRRPRLGGLFLAAAAVAATRAGGPAPCLPVGAARGGQGRPRAHAPLPWHQ